MKPQIIVSWLYRFSIAGSIIWLIAYYRPVIIDALTTVRYCTSSLENPEYRFKLDSADEMHFDKMQKKKFNP